MNRSVLRALCSLSAVPAALLAQHTASRPAEVDVYEASASELQAAMSSGHTTAVAITQAYLARIAAFDHAGPMLNTIVRLNPRAMREAAALDAERKAGHVRGPLHGIPIILKDNYDTGDMPTSAGSLALANSQPLRDAFVVKRLRDAGAIVLAKANMQELAAGINGVSSFGGQTRNPYDPTRCPGGSSAGTGAAIAASFAAIGWGSDTCGSIRIPSAFNSLVGLRPTQGMISRTGIIPLMHTQDIGGPMARTVMDLAIALDVSVVIDPADSVTQVLAGRPAPQFVRSLDRNALRGARIGVFAPYFTDTDPEIADSVRAVLAAMKAQGAEIVDAPMPDFDSVIVNSSASMEFKFDFINYMKTIPNPPVRSLRGILDRGLYAKSQEARYTFSDTVSGPDTDDHRRVFAKQAILRARLEQLLDSLHLDALAYPTMRQKPVLFGEVQNGATCAASAQSGLPAISMQAGLSSEGLPIGLELLGRRFSDARLVSLAYALEQSGARRRAPTTTPRLTHGTAPIASSRAVITAAGALSAATRIVVDAVNSELRWSSSVRGPIDAFAALVLRRKGATMAVGGPLNGKPGARLALPDTQVRVVARLLGPGMTRGSGTIPLSYADRIAFDAGRLSIMLLPTTGAAVERIVARR